MTQLKTPLKTNYPLGTYIYLIFHVNIMTTVCQCSVRLFVLSSIDNSSEMSCVRINPTQVTPHYSTLDAIYSDTGIHPGENCI